MGTGQPNVNGQSLANLLLPLPPLSEQERIDTKINELMAMCDELEVAEKDLDALESRLAEYLPKSILQAAVRGKLVPQDPNDEPATELLKRIRQEKARLIRDGKIKKEKSLPPIAEDETPYVLPKGWVWCRLGDVCDYGACENAEPENIADEAWLLELEDIEKDTGALVCRVAKKNRACMSTKHKFYARQVLYGKLRPYLNKALIADSEGYCASEILPLDFGCVSPAFAVISLRSPGFVEYATRKSYGVKMPRLGTNDGRLALFTLPPLAEQQRIAAKVDELMVLCGELKNVESAPATFAPSNIISFPAVRPRTAEEPVAEDWELGLAARGDATHAHSTKLQQDIDAILGDDDNE